MTLEDVIDIWKENKELGFTSYMPRCILRFWLILHLYILHDMILFTDELMNFSIAFMIFNPTSHEIVIIAVDKQFQRKGNGSLLIRRISHFGKCWAITDKKTEKFYHHNGYLRFAELDKYRVLVTRII